MKVKTKTGEVHEVWKYIKAADGREEIWCNSWYGHHAIGFDCEWLDASPTPPPDDLGKWIEDVLASTREFAINNDCEISDKGWDEFVEPMIENAIKATHENYFPEIQKLKEEIERLKVEKGYLLYGIEILKELCNLKHYKDTVGKDSLYESKQPLLWRQANDFLNPLVGVDISSCRDQTIEQQKK